MGGYQHYSENKPVTCRRNKVQNAMDSGVFDMLFPQRNEFLAKILSILFLDITNDRVPASTGQNNKHSLT
jgi:hypothetical protein